MEPTPEVQPPLLRTEQVAKWLQISRYAVLRLAETGDLPCVQLTARLRRYRTADVEHFVQSRLTGSSS